MNIKFIKKLRIDNDYSQDYVSKEIGISRAAYISVEQDKRQLSLNEADALCKL